MARRKARSVWVWCGSDGMLRIDRVIESQPDKNMCPGRGGTYGYTHFREVLPKKGKVTRAKK